MNAQVIIDTINAMDIDNMEMADIISTLVATLLSTVDDDGNVKDFDMETLKAIVKSLQDTKKAFEEVAKAASDARKKAKEALFAQSNVKLFSELVEGDRIRYWYATGKCWVEATVGKQKAGAKTLHVLLDEGTYTGEKPDRYLRNTAKVELVEAEEAIA